MSHSLRNVNFYDGSTNAYLGGVEQSGSITNANFFHMLMDILIIVNGIPTIRHRATGQKMPLNTERLVEGDYDIFPAQGEIKLTDEVCVRRVFSREERTSREDPFRDGVRARDGRCVLTGRVNTRASFNDWRSFQAAHIFPMARRRLWEQCGFDRLITRPGRHPINSVQNGLLLKSDVHEVFDSYGVSVNPDDGYKITDFAGNMSGVDGGVLDPVCRNPNHPDRVSDDLLRWHYRQSVLANVKGAGEPIFEHDFPPGTDMMKEILEGPYPAEHMELQLFSRLQSPKEDDESVY